MRSFVLILIFSINSTLILSQRCTPYGNAFIDSQEQIDNFRKNYPGCTEIDGTMVLIGEIYNLDSLIGIKAIHGDLVINNTSLENLYGINQIDSLEGILSITGNTQMEYIDGFDKIITLNLLNISRNNILQEIHGFSNLRTAKSSISITKNPLLENICALDSLVSCGTINISENITLSKLKAMYPLKETQGDFLIIDNRNLADLNIAPNVKTVGGKVVLRNILVDSLSVFKKLESCMELVIEVGSSLLYLHPFDSLKTAKNGLNVSSNPSLLQIDGFNSLINSDNITIRSRGLREIRGFNNIENVDGKIWLIGNIPASMELIDGFHSLKYVGILSIALFHDLRTINAFQKLEKARRIGISESLSGEIDFEFFSNLKLIDTLYLVHLRSDFTDLHGFRNIDYTKLKHLTITANNDVLICHVEPICRYLDEEIGYYRISNGKPACRDKEAILERCILSTIETENSPYIYLYPNPTTGKFAIETEADFDIKIFDQAGREVAYNRYNDIISLRDNVPGVYFVEVRTAGRIYTQQLLVVR
jgi:hypothetical protein